MTGPEHVRAIDRPHVRAVIDHIAQRVAQARLDQGMSRKELARRTGFSPALLRKIEAGGKELYVGTVLVVAEHLSIDPAELFTAPVLDPTDVSNAKQPNETT